jgi:hypothetical protein
MLIRHFVAGLGLLAAAMLTTASASHAEIVHFKADLKAANEVPPFETAGSGKLTATYDSSAHRLTWEGSYSGLTGPASAAHIHGPAGPSGSAGVVFWISDNVGQCDKGGCRFKPGVKVPLGSPFHGSAQLTDVETSELMSGQFYINIHTDAHPAGELRGQLLIAN